MPKGIARCVSARYHWEYSIRQVYEVFIFLPLGNAFATASVWTTVSLSVERYITVKHHILSHRVWSVKRTRLCVILIFVLAVLINIPNFWYRTTNFGERYPSVSDFGMSRGFYIFLWIRITLLKGLPFILILVFNALLVKAVREVNRRRRSMVFPLTSDNRRQHLQVRITAMMIAISVVFLLCHAMEPFVHAPVYAAIHGECRLGTKAYVVQRAVANTLEVFSFSSNFFFYCIFHKQFVSTLKLMFPACHDRRWAMAVSDLESEKKVSHAGSGRQW